MTLVATLLGTNVAAAPAPPQRNIHYLTGTGHRHEENCHVHRTASAAPRHRPYDTRVDRRPRLPADRTAGRCRSGHLDRSALSLVSCRRPLTGAAASRRHGRIDLTYTLGEDFPAYTPGEEAIRQPATTIPANGYYMQRWEMYEHTGTHVDAPAHFNANGRYASELTPDELMVPAVVIDIARRAATEPDTVVTVADLHAHERRHGRIEDRAAVLMYSGWGARVADRRRLPRHRQHRRPALPRLQR